MTGDLRFSVIVASRDRPQWLQRCLTALRQIDHPSFEVIVSADDRSLATLKGSDFKRVPSNEANISVTRNAGIVAAAGDVCAFIDDDAVPEPMWLKHHQDALLASGAEASVGYVRGRNGISFQSKVASIDCEAETHQEPSPKKASAFPNLRQGRALKLIGTNFTVRRDALMEVGGFDPAYEFFLDDADLSLRLAHSGARSISVPLAEVHHGFAASSRRTSRRAPTRLYDIGRSSAVFLRRFNGIDEDELWQRLLRRERARLLRHLVKGTCEPSDVSKLLLNLRAGWDAGMQVALQAIPSLNSANKPYLRMPPLPQGHSVMCSRLYRRAIIQRSAESCAREGKRVSHFSFSLTSFRHSMRYTDSGVWLQKGGQFGRSIRDQRRFKWCRFADRKKLEIQRVAFQRGIKEIE